MCNMRHPAALPEGDESDAPDTAPVLRVLAVGDLAPSTLPTAPTADVVVARFNDITAAQLAVWRPALVLAPLVGAGFDCFDLAERLTGAGFSGRLRAVVDSLPNPAVVRREIATHFPALDFDVIVLSDRG